MEIVATTVDHYFPTLPAWLADLSDSRDQDRIVYSRETVVWAGLVGMMSKVGSRARMRVPIATAVGIKNLGILSGQENLEGVPHGDTLEYFLRRGNLREFEELQAKMVGRLLRTRVLERYRLQGQYYTIAIDGVHVKTFEYAHCGECVVCERDDGQRQWRHYKLQASLVSKDGLSLPIAQEWIENEKGYEKQDCELKAFYRLVKKLRDFYPRLRICLLLDGLYAVEPVFEALRQARIKWIVVLKKGRSPQRYDWVMGWKERYGKHNVLTTKRARVIEERNPRSHAERLTRKKAEHKKREVVTVTTHTWMSDIEDVQDRRRYNVMTCKEVCDGKTKCDYVWLVSEGLGLNAATVRELAAAGRSRWVIENQGFNTQKNGGYGLGHCYSRDEVAMKLWDVLMNIAHLINQLVEKGSLIVRKEYRRLKDIACAFLKDFREHILEKPPNRPRIQIRLCQNTS